MRTITTLPRTTANSAYPLGATVVPIYDADLDPEDRSGPGTVIRVDGLAHIVRHDSGDVALWADFELAPFLAAELPAAA